MALALAWDACGIYVTFGVKNEGGNAAGSRVIHPGFNYLESGISGTAAGDVFLTADPRRGESQWARLGLTASNVS